MARKIIKESAGYANAMQKLSGLARTGGNQNTGVVPPKRTGGAQAPIAVNPRKKNVKARAGIKTRDGRSY